MSSLLSPSAPLLGRRRLDLAYPSASPRRGGLHCPQPIKALSSADPPKETPVKTTTEATQPPAPSPPKRPVYSMKKGQIVRVDKEKYLSSINVLDLRIFETGEYALIAWVGIPTAPAWLPTYMLIKSEKLDYERI
ncbi:NAD(P)H-quinone oxidoreductase subunit O, chloroplastic isoform X2 [Curcuma longa]|uniref:NAD(P)H-quinone oxidoreductase subunit O, chloroplastic isoform X2 n=1 Tax=Curcuma longa TaxID=136217 RepID=UPI003D9DBDFB